MRRGRHHYRRSKDPGELQVTAFLNLMVVLVPFLLITAVFSQVSILQLNLPRAGGADSSDRPDFQVELFLREDSLEIGDGRRVIHRINVSNGEHNFGQLTEVLLEIKRNYPDRTTATLLVEPDVTYDLVVAAMDRLRVAEVFQVDSVQRIELFPDISVGDAPT